MKIKIKENCVGLDFSFYFGQEVDVKKSLGDDLIKAGYAEEIKILSKKTAKSGDK